MIINLAEIKTYSLCPRLYALSKDARDFDKRDVTLITQQVVQKAYLVASDTGHRVDWRRFVGWVDKLVFKNIDISDEKAFSDARILSERTLNALTPWYEGMYREEDSIGLTDIPVGCTVNGDIVIKGMAPIIKLSGPTLMIFSDFVSNRAKLYNDIEIRGLAALVSDAIDSDTIIVQHFAVGERGKLEFNELHVGKAANERTLSVIGNIANLIKNRISYPSISDKCNSCIYFKECVL